MKLLIRTISIAAILGSVVIFMYGLGAFAGHPSKVVISLIDSINNLLPGVGPEMFIYVITGLILVSVVLFVSGMVFWIFARKFRCE